MKKLIQIITFVFIGINSYSQTCPYLGPDQILPCGVLSTTLTADLTNCAPGSQPKQTTSYVVTNIPFAPSPVGGATVAMTDDSQSGPYPIGFNFCFFGNTYTQFYIGSNGWISFSAGQPTTFTSATIPSGAGTIPKNCIMGPWQDWHPGIAGGPYIRYQTQGTAPCRRLVVSWTNCPMYSCNGVVQPDVDSDLIVNWSEYDTGQYVIGVELILDTNCSSMPVYYAVDVIDCSNNIYVPNAFTPDNDQSNNIWIPIGYNYTEINYFIVNRWVK